MSDSSEIENPLETVVKEFAKKQQILIDLENEEELKTHKEVKQGVLTVTLSKTLGLNHDIVQVEFDRTSKDGKSEQIGFSLGDTLLCAKDLKASSTTEINEEAYDEDAHCIRRGILVALDAKKITVYFLCHDWSPFRNTPLETTFSLTDHFDAFTHNTMTSALSELSKFYKRPIVRIAFEDDKEKIGNLLAERDPSFANGVKRYRNQALSQDQRGAVVTCLQRKNLVILQGPPGTGKTTTLLEVIQQFCEKNKRVLFCAPTNVAVDNLVVKLGETQFKPLRTGNVLRMSEEARPHSLDYKMRRHKDYKAIRILEKKIKRGNYNRKLVLELGMRKAALIRLISRDYRVICCTLAMSSFEDSHVITNFDVVIIDEASQALEASTWVGIPNAQKLILAGDIHQLQPMVSCQKAKSQGLGISLMERLIDKLGKEAYVSLITQFRMNSKIMAWSNKHFYENKLIAHESVKDKVPSDLPRVLKAPITMNSVMHIDTADCGFWFMETTSKGKSIGNIGEAVVVSNLIQDLVFKQRIPQDKIGVITPYQLQCNLIQNLLKHLPHVEVKTVDGFQGREKEVIVLSFVRSNPKRVLGFVENKRRLNVAVTRAKKLLAVVANTKTVGSCKIINDLLKHIKANGIYESGETYAQKDKYKFYKLQRIIQQGLIKNENQGKQRPLKNNDKENKPKNKPRKKKGKGVKSEVTKTE